MASPCFRAQAARQGIPRLNLRSQKRHVRFSGAKAAVKPQFAAHSRMVDRFLLLFLVQQDLGEQWQRAMNYEQVDVARQIQKRKGEIEKAVEHHMFSRASFFSDATKAGDSMDALAQAVTLQSRLNEAVEQQDFSQAAILRDELQAAKDKTEVPVELSEEQKPRMQLGQRVLVKDDSLQDPLPAVVVGWDTCCSESTEWKERYGCRRLKMGAEQPFYHLLIDQHAWEAGDWDTVMIPCAYVPQEKLYAPADEGSTWLQKYAGHPLEEFTHPYSYVIFLGKDNVGDFVPVPELRNLYGVPRKDVYPPEGDPEGDAGESTGDQK